jgi:hypothetical protein
VNEDRPYCPASAAKRIVKIRIDGLKIGIAQFEDILVRASYLNLGEDEVIAQALLKEVKIYNYVPINKEQDYKAAIIAEYFRRESDGKKN